MAEAKKIELEKLTRPELGEVARSFGYEFDDEDKEVTKKVLIAEIKKRQAEKFKNTHRPEGYEIIETYTGQLFRVYQDQEQAESFVKKFPAYHLKVEEIKEQKGQTTMSESRKFKVVSEFEIEGTVHAVDSEIELSEEAAAPFVEAGQLVAVE